MHDVCAVCGRPENDLMHEVGPGQVFTHAHDFEPVEEVK